MLLYFYSEGNIHGEKLSEDEGKIIGQYTEKSGNSYEAVPLGKPRKI